MIPNDTQKLYLVRAGSNGEDETVAIDDNLALIDYRKYPTLANCKDFGDVLKLVEIARPDLNVHAARNHASQLWAFCSTMKTGDLLVLPRKLTSQVAIGRVTGLYKYRHVGGESRHTRSVEWLRPDVPRSVFHQDLLFSFGAFMTVCEIKRNNAFKRVTSVLAGNSDPGFQLDIKIKKTKSEQDDTEQDDNGQADAPIDLDQAAHDQIVAHIQSRFSGHGLSRLVEAVLRADGWVTKLSPPGADGGIDILAGRGSLGLDQPHLCVQVKSQPSPVDVTVFRTLQGSMQSFKAEQGLLVAWGGYNKAVQSESKQGHFTVRLWESRDLVEAIYRNYEKLPAEIQADLPLKRVWVLIHEELEA